MIRLSNAADRLQGQEMFQILAKAQELERQGKQIMHFELGDPDFNTPKNIVNACCDALKRGDTHYTNSRGVLELRIAAAESTARGARGFKPDLDQVIVTPSGNAQIFYAIGCTVNPGEEVIVPDPGFASYFGILNFYGINPARVQLKEENKFRLNPEDVEKAVTDKTRLIIINSPSNPTGAVMTEDQIRAVYEIAKKHDLWLLTDEVYRRTVYDDSDAKFFSPSVIDKCKERTIVVNSFSKSYAMTGWRIGTATAPSHLIEKMALLIETTTSCVSPFIQRAAIEALNGSQDFSDYMRQEYKRRREVIVKGLNSLPGVSCVKPDGAFYAFPNITETGMNSREFSDFMLDSAGVALAPGTVFGQYGEGYARLSYATSVENIEIGIDRIQYALKHKKFT